MNEFTVVYLDSDNNTLQTSGDLRGTWAKSSYSITYAGPSAVTDVQVQAVGGNALEKTFNASNTGLIASAKINGNDYAGGRAELHFNYDPKAIATDEFISSSDTTVNFSFNSLNLKSIINSDSKFSVWVYNAKGDLNGIHSQFTIKQDFRVPDAPRKLFISDGANSTKNVEFQITATQSANGKATLYVDSQLLAQDNYISANDGFINFNLNMADANKLTAAIGLGNAEVKLFDVMGNFVTQNLQSLPLFNGSASSFSADITPPTGSELYIRPQPSTSGSSPYSKEVIFKFSEPVSKQIQLSQFVFTNSMNMEFDHNLNEINSSQFTWNVAGTELTLKSGARDFFYSAEKITIIGVQDLAGNISDISFNILK